MPAYTEVEKRFMGAVATSVGEALRASLARASFAAPDATAGVGAGTLILDADHRPDGATREARYWLQRLGLDDGASLPPSMRWVAFQAHARERLASAGRVVRPARVRMPLADGTWLLVQADPLTGATETRTALTLRPAGRTELLALQLAVHGLTPREAQVAEALVDGRTSTEIADALQLSRHTVRDHTKVVYAKTRVHSRTELAALLLTGVRPAERGGRDLRSGSAAG
jgi:DNA-binding CsgD family transcriptional regulator